MAMAFMYALAHISKNATGKQGQAMGFAESYMSLGRIIGPLWGGMIFDVNIFYPFLSGFFILSAAFLATLGKLKPKTNTGLNSEH